MAKLQAVTKLILETRISIPAERSVLVAISGIDGCGKGHFAAQLQKQLAAQGVRAATISVDGWLNLPHVRFDRSNPAEHFYLHAIRFDEMFSQLVLPLRDRRSLRLEADYAEEQQPGIEGTLTNLKNWMSSYSKASIC
jgi:uridine kinase